MIIPALTIDALRATHAKPQYFGLGFIQLKLNPQHRLHFWVPDWPSIPDATVQWHNHRYAFVSTVLQGVLTQDVGLLETPWRSSPLPNDWEVIEVTCQPQSSQPPSIQGYTTVQDPLTIHTHAGQRYRLTPDQFHRSYAQPGLITHVVKDNHTRPTAHVLRPIDSPFVCPFSWSISPQECWDTIAAMLPTSPLSLGFGSRIFTSPSPGCS